MTIYMYYVAVITLINIHVGMFRFISTHKLGILNFGGYGVLVEVDAETRIHLK